MVTRLEVLRRPMLLALAVLLAAAGAHAHRGHAVWTDIHWVGDRFELVHRMHLADAIAVNRYMGNRQAIEDMRSLAVVALYVEERFKLLPGAATPAADEQRVLETIGAEIEDDFILVYQEWRTRLPTRFPRVDNRLLLDIEPEAQAFIKIDAPGISEERER